MLKDPAFRCALCLCRVGVLNDFEAVGYGIPALGEADIVPINMALSEPKVIASTQIAFL